jgi:hypothetical protein
MQAFANRIRPGVDVAADIWVLAAFAVVAAAGFYFCTAGDRAECDQARVVESGEEP